MYEQRAGKTEGGKLGTSLPGSPALSQAGEYSAGGGTLDAQVASHMDLKTGLQLPGITANRKTGGTVMAAPGETELLELSKTLVFFSVSKVYSSVHQEKV